jgi:hypothetical protein
VIVTAFPPAFVPVGVDQVIGIEIFVIELVSIVGAIITAGIVSTVAPMMLSSE